MNRQELIESCEGCNPNGAEIPFDDILDALPDPSVTDYILEEPAKCPNCFQQRILKGVRFWKRRWSSLTCHEKT